MIDQVISHYRIVRKLGAGGMGEVYLAQDATLGRQVALKILPREHTQDPERLRRFKQEAKAASALNHPNILTIHEVGEADGHHFIATEFIDGESLRALFERSGSLATGEALRIAAQIASALAAAHQAGIVHRDIKPENIMLRRDGYVKVLDFGLAKLTEAKSVNQTGSIPEQTVSGIVLGTTRYMSPEQATGAKVDARSDIFSFGATLYEMLSGHAAFDAETPTATIAAILTKDPAPLPATTPGELVNVVARCLRKDPARRYQSMADLKVALEDLREVSAARGHQARSTWSRRAWAALLPILLAAGFFAWKNWRSPNAQPLQAVPLTTLPGVARYPSLSPDGDRVVFSWNGSQRDNPDIYVQQIGSGSPLRLTSDSANDFNPVWSPDGRWIAFLRSESEASKSEVRLIPPLGGPERKLAGIRARGGLVVTPPYLAWCPDSSCVIATDSPGEQQPDALFVISLETGEKRQLTHPRPPAGGDANPAVSSDGKWLVFRRMANLFVGELYRLSLATGVIPVGEPQRITAPTMNADHAAWIPDSKEILFSAKGSLWRMTVPGEGKPSRLPFVGESGIMPVVSRPQSGRPPRLVYVRSVDDWNIWRVETAAVGVPATSPPRVSVASTRLDDMAQLSADGRKVAFTSDRSGGWEIWTANPDGSNAVQITSIGAVGAGYPHWSPDGEQIVFHSNPEGQWDLYVVSAAGGKARKLTSHPASDAFPSFSRDGRWIYFSSNRTGPQDQTLWKIPSAGGDAIQLTKTAAYAPQESPDGRYIYYVETVDRPSSLWRLPASGGASEKVLDGVALANFVVLREGIYYIDRPTGERGIHYVDLPSAEGRLQFFDFTTRRSTTIADNLGQVDTPLAVSPDGRTIMYGRLDSSVNDLMLVTNFR